MVYKNRKLDIQVEACWCHGLHVFAEGGRDCWLQEPEVRSGSACGPKPSNRWLRNVTLSKYILKTLLEKPRISCIAPRTQALQSTLTGRRKGILYTWGLVMPGAPNSILTKLPSTSSRSPQEVLWSPDIVPKYPAEYAEKASREGCLPDIVKVVSESL